MNTTTRTRKIKLNRVMNGWYTFNSHNYEHVFDIHKVGPGAWTIKHQDYTFGSENVTEEGWIVEDLDKARSFIASAI